jgi:hypothetical protein
MKYIITESRLEKAIMEYLDKEFIPDYGWYENTRTAGTYQDDVDRWGDLVFFINDIDSYIYYGCNAGDENDKLFAGYGKLNEYKCPLLSIHPAVSQQLSDYFGDMWKPIFKKWFEENTGLPVSQLTDDYI